MKRISWVSINGKIDLHDFEMSVRKLSKNSLKGKIGRGGALLQVKTSNNDIKIYPLK